jgi:predicted nucleotidyltransferase
MPGLDQTEATPLLAEVPGLLQRALGADLLALYFYGSLASGDFDEGVSDIDLLAVTARTIDGAQFARLDGVHQAIVSAHPAWDDRLEIAYVSAGALRTFRAERSDIGIISPGEPFHMKDAGADWLVNWYVVREMGVTLSGPPAAAFIAPISAAEYVQGVRDYGVEWLRRRAELRTRNAQAYAIITLCRALYTLRHGKYVTKKRAAEWAMGELPEWAPLIRNALAWRMAFREPGVDHDAPRAETWRFVEEMVGRINASPPGYSPSPDAGEGDGG